MPVAFVCGFDLEENRPDVSSLLGTGSYALSYSTQNGAREQTAPGEGGGGAFRKTRTVSFPATGGAIMDVPEGRIYLWMNIPEHNSDAYRNIVGLTSIAAGVTYTIRMDGQGRFKIGTAGGSVYTALGSNQVTTESEESVYTFPVNTWLPLELYVSSEGYMMLYIGGNAVLGMACPPWQAGGVAHGLSSTVTTIPLYDHVVISSTGGPLVGQDVVHAVVPTASVSGAGSSWAAGCVVMNGKRYMGPSFGPNTEETVEPGGGAGAYVGYSVFNCNPETGGPWGTLDDLEFDWGFCSISAGATRRIHAMACSIVVSDPFVRVITYPPSGLTYRSGVWNKSHEDWSTQELLGDRPRVFAPAEEDGYYWTTQQGCLLTKLSKTPGLFTSGITFAEEKRDDNLDWRDILNADGLNYDSYFMSGFNVLGEGNKDFQSNYVTVQYDPVPNGGAYIQGTWDYSQHPSTGRWSTRQQVYRLADERNFASLAKLKIRGRGKALQLRVESEENKPFSISGWTMAASSNGTV